jgi:hypothetical protein
MGEGSDGGDGQLASAARRGRTAWTYRYELGRLLARRFWVCRWYRCRRVRIRISVDLRGNGSTSASGSPTVPEMWTDPVLGNSRSRSCAQYHSLQFGAAFETDGIE